jgi:HEAT repeat protein
MKEFEEMVKFLTELKNDPNELTRIRLEMACERVNNNRTIKPKSVFEFLEFLNN